MKYEEIISLLVKQIAITSCNFYQVVMDDSTKPCKDCLRYAGMVYMDRDPSIPHLPLHPNCDCHLAQVSEADYLKQQNFKFGEMTPEKWAEQSIEEKYLWCNAFRKKFGDLIDQYAQEHNVPKQLLAGVIANEMLDWHFPDGSPLDGVTGGGIGFAQISISTAKQHGFDGGIRQKLNSADGSVEIAAKILSDYIQYFRKSQTKGALGAGFITSDLYYKATPRILERDNLVNIQVQAWLLGTMCAAWNSGIDIIHAKDEIGEYNYRNADIHGQNSSILLNYLPKLVNP